MALSHTSSDLFGQPVYEDYEYVKLDMPYVPGFLAFREASHLLKLFNKLKNDPSKSQFYPEVVLADGNGILHNNGCGIASHLGVHLGIPTIGCGKTVFFVDGLRKVKIFSASITSQQATASAVAHAASHELLIASHKH